MKIYSPIVISLILYFNTFGQIGFEEHIVSDKNTPPVYSPSSIIAVDIDQDGLEDILYTESSKIGWYKNTNGNISRGLEKRIIGSNLSNPKGIYTNDIDKDGDLDVFAIMGSNFGEVIWFENLDGKGNFGTKQIVTTSVRQPKSVFAADLDSDGHTDLLSASWQDKKLSWYRNTNGEGNFDEQQVIELLSGIFSVFATDIDNDGDIDVISNTSDTVVWFENLDGNGNFGTRKVLARNLDEVRSVSAADIDMDGDMDIISASFKDNTVAWYENLDGEGTFGSHSIISNEANGAKLIRTKDMDKDGDIDILAASFDKVAYFENTDGQGSFIPRNILSETVFGPSAVYPSDLDNDGDIDIVSCRSTENRIAWQENIDGLGTYGILRTITNRTYNPTDIYVADIDGDGDNDLVSATRNLAQPMFDGSTISWHENMDGKGSFGSQNILNTDMIGAEAIYASDIDNDGDMDILSTSITDGKIAWYKNVDGKGNFGPQQVLSSGELSASSIHAADIDGDQDMDVFSVNRDDVYWFENTDGQGNFSTPNDILKFANFPTSVSTADIDGDNDLDILYANTNVNDIEWWENMDGLGGSFSRRSILNLAIDRPDHPESLITADLDNDGDIDVISASEDDDRIAWYENKDGLGNFERPITISTQADRAIEVFAADIDNDGDIDLISASRGDNKIAWYENIDGQGTFGAQQILSTMTDSPSALFAADLDNDGDIDVISTSSFDEKIAWYENLGILGNEINGMVKYGLGLGGCDINAIAASNIMVVADNGSNSFGTFTSNDGSYAINVNLGNFVSTVTSTLPSFYSINPISQTSSFSDLGNTETVNFCIESNQTINDLNVSIIPVTEARPGFTSEYQLVYQNIGTTQLSGNITLEFDNSKINYISSSELPSEQSGNRLIFNFENMNPFEIRTIDLAYSVYPPPTVNINDNLSFRAIVNPVNNDFSIEDNEFILDQIVIGSFDPNDIKVLEGDQIFLQEIGNYLHYLIRFQNTGTAEAINVRVDHQLDTNLDWGSLQLESSSHPYLVEIIDGNQVSFIFNNILLPDSETDEPNSNGFITFKVKPKQNISVGDVINATADITFDFNIPINTNTVTTEIIEVLSTPNFESTNITIYPVPAKNIVYINSIDQQIKSIRIYSISGTKLLEQNDINEIDISNLSRGVYFLKVISQEGEIIKKIIKE